MLPIFLFIITIFLYENYMHPECPMCGRKMENSGWESYFANDPIETKNQIDNLDRILEGLKNGKESIITLAQEQYEMCPLCQDVMKDVEKESDRHTLEERINQGVLNLKSKKKISFQDIYNC